MVIHNSVPYWAYDEKPDLFRPLLGLSKAERILLFQGGLRHFRNLDKVIKMAPLG